MVQEKVLKLGGVLAACMMLSVPAAAATISCTGTTSAGQAYDIAGRVSGTQACAMLLPLDTNDADTAALANSNAFFGLNNWQLDGRFTGLNGTPNDNSDRFAFTGDGSAGSFSYVGGPAAPGSVMFLFRDGNNTNLVAYLLSSPTGSGSYLTPFSDPPFDLPRDVTSRNINRIGVYYSASVARVPEPASLALVALGLLGIAGLRRKG